MESTLNKQATTASDIGLMRRGRMTACVAIAADYTRLWRHRLLESAADFILEVRGKNVQWASGGILIMTSEKYF